MSPGSGQLRTAMSPSVSNAPISILAHTAGVSVHFYSLGQTPGTELPSPRCEHFRASGARGQAPGRGSTSQCLPLRRERPKVTLNSTLWKLGRGEQELTRGQNAGTEVPVTSEAGGERSTLDGPLEWPSSWPLSTLKPLLKMSSRCHWAFSHHWAAMASLTPEKGIPGREQIWGYNP